VSQGSYEQTDRELKEYRSVRAEGIQPEGTTMNKIELAKLQRNF